MDSGVGIVCAAAASATCIFAPCRSRPSYPLESTPSRAQALFPGRYPFFGHEPAQVFQLHADTGFVMVSRGLLDLPAHLFYGRKSVPASRPLEIMTEAPDRLELLQGQPCLRFLDLPRLRGKIFRDQRSEEHT